MRAAGTPLARRVGSIGAWALGLAIVGVAASAMSFAPKRALLEPGSVVSYAEDRLGRPWTIVRRIGYQTFEIRNGRVLVIAEANDMSAYHGYSSDVSIELAGMVWRDKVQEIQRAGRTPEAPRAVTEIARNDH
jgi:hypothetical protein